MRFFGNIQKLKNVASGQGWLGKGNSMARAVLGVSTTVAYSYYIQPTAFKAWPTLMQNEDGTKTPSQKDFNDQVGTGAFIASLLVSFRAGSRIPAVGVASLIILAGSVVKNNMASSKKDPPSPSM